MITVTRKAFLTWVLSQPDNKLFNINEFEIPCGCGCPMVQYGMEVLKLSFDAVSTIDWYCCGEGGKYVVAKFEDNVSLCSIFECNQFTEKCETFEQLKKIIIDPPVDIKPMQSFVVPYKYNRGNTVYFMENNKIQQAEIESIRISIEVRTSIHYRFLWNNSWTILEESLLFPTREALIATL